MSKPDFKHSYTKVNQETNFEKSDTPIKYGFGVRHIQLILIFMYITTAFLSRGHLSVTIVGMTKNLQNSNVLANNTTIGMNKTDGYNLDAHEVNVIDLANDTEKQNISIHDDVISKVDSQNVYQQYNWTKPVQEMVLSSFFAGYCIMMFPIGIICQRWGGKLPLQISLFVSGVISLVSPWLAMVGGWKAVCACRLIQGLAQAATFPACQTLVARWVSTSERASLLSYVYSGTNVGTVIGFQISGFLMDTALGWPGVYWVIGVLCMISFVLLTVYGAESPFEHNTISEEEKYYISGSVVNNVKKRKAPWKSILTSRPVWAVLSTQVFSGMSFTFFFTQVPTYIHYILGINVRQSGLLSSLPYTTNVITSIIFGVLSDYLTNRNLISKINGRRLFNSISQIGVASMLVCASYADSTVTAVICLSLSMGFNAAVHCGWMVNIIDIAPNYAGTLMSFGNTIMNVGNILLPALTSSIVVDVRNPFQWRIMIFLMAGLAVVANVIFVLFLSTDLQDWNDEKVEEEYEIEEIKLDTSKTNGETLKCQDL